MVGVAVVRFLFVGERPSPRAKAIGATWRNGRLSGKTLRAALEAAGYNPTQQRYTNVFVCGSGRLSSWSVWRIRKAQEERLVVVAMGRKVQRVLKRARVYFVPLIHPAARGRVRQTEVYQAHVRGQLRTADPETPW